VTFKPTHLLSYEGRTSVLANGPWEALTLTDPCTAVQT